MVQFTDRITSTAGIKTITWPLQTTWTNYDYVIHVQPLAMPNYAGIRVRNKGDTSFDLAVVDVDSDGNTIDCSVDYAEFDLFMLYRLKPHGQ